MADDTTQIEGAIAEAPQWRRWLACLVLGSAGGAAMLFAFILLIDPYTTGRLALSGRLDMASGNASFAKAAVIRDPQFDTAIVGASTGDSLDPAHISGISNRSVAQLSIQGTNPANVRLISRTFERHRRGKPTWQIIVIDLNWCHPRLATEIYPMPKWVYQSSDLEYLSEIFNAEALRTAIRRIGIWIGTVPQSIRVDGYSFRLPLGFDPRIAARDIPTMPPLAVTNDWTPDAPFPEIEALAAHIGGLDRSTTILLAVLPVFTSTFEPGSPAERREAMCRSRLQDIAAARPNTAVHDMRSNSDMAQDPPSYIDQIHFHDRLARIVEKRIGEAVRDLGPTAHK